MNWEKPEFEKDSKEINRKLKMELILSTILPPYNSI